MFLVKDGHNAVAGGVYSSFACLLAIALITACGEPGEDYSSDLACNDYCEKAFDCDEHEPTGEETSTCVGECRNSIEDNCGNDKQPAANEKIRECVDLSCDDFDACMVFDAAPECFEFAHD